MNWTTIEGEWKQIKGQLKSKWAKLTDDDVQSLSAKRDALVGKIQERYGVMKDDAERQVDEWIAKLDSSPRGGERDGSARGRPH
jgi:uncharacterized protein YjbJ (UPF0337 family)